MGEKETGGVRKTYVAKNVGAGARVQQGEHNVMQDIFQSTPGGEDLAGRFDALLERIAGAAELDDDEKELSRAKAASVAESLARICADFIKQSNPVEIGCPVYKDYVRSIIVKRFKP